MKNFYILTQALEYMEANICEPLDGQMTADHCCVSLSSLQKLLRIALNKSVHEYIIKRRICLAARDLLNTDARVTDIAYKYQFGSPEAFTRAFCKVWKETPVSYRKHWKFSGIFPRINYVYSEGADENMARKNVDISEAYDVLKEMKNTYVLCFDIAGMDTLNGISRQAGDLAILEAARRIDEISTQDMLLLRIGGDEFALLTGLEEESRARELAEKVLAQNGECIVWEEQSIPLSLHCAVITAPDGSLNYGSFFSSMHEAIDRSK